MHSRGILVGIFEGIHRTKFCKKMLSIKISEKKMENPKRISDDVSGGCHREVS